MDLRDGFLAAVPKFEESIKSSENKLSTKEWLALLGGWLESELTEDTEGTFQAVSRRYVFVFPSGLMLTVGTSIPLTVAGLHEELNENSLPKSLASLPLKWEYKRHANGFAAEGTTAASLDEAEQILGALEADSGAPDLFLPWEGYQELLEEIEDDEDFEGAYGDEEVEFAFYKLINLLYNNDNLSDVSPWQLWLVGPDQMMSNFCSLSRFYRFIDDMEQDGKFRIFLEEHCAACYSGSNEQLIQDQPELAGAPVFITWGQNSHNNYLPDGSIYTGDQDYDEDWPMEYIRKLATKHGLECDEFGSLS